MSTQKQERLLSQKPEIIVATPGRFWELLEEVKYLEEKQEIHFLNFRIMNILLICLIFDFWLLMKLIE
jgi:superfamily II DNA/RNA helicase